MIFDFLNYKSDFSKKDCQCTDVKSIDGKAIFRKVIALSDVATFSGIEWAEKYVRAEWVWFINWQTEFIYVDKIWPSGITFKHTHDSTEWVIAIYYTKTISNNDLLMKWVWTSAIIAWVIALAVTSIWLVSKHADILASFWK